MAVCKTAPHQAGGRMNASPGHKQVPPRQDGRMGAGRTEMWWWLPDETPVRPVRQCLVTLVDLHLWIIPPQRSETGG